MSSANGVCHHNNQMGYCPSCSKEKTMRGMGRGMGAANCQPGYYEAEIFGIKTGQCLPSSGTLLNAAQGAVVSTTATGIANSQATQTAVANAAAASLGVKILNFYKQKPVIAYGATALVVLLTLAGTGLVRIPGISRR